MSANNNVGNRRLSWWTMFHESLWFHYADYKVGATQLENSYEGWVDVTPVEREEHYGSKYACRKCRREGTMGNFTNFPTGRGFVFYGFLWGAVITLIVKLLS